MLREACLRTLTRPQLDYISRMCLSCNSNYFPRLSSLDTDDQKFRIWSSLHVALDYRDTCHHQADVRPNNISHECESTQVLVVALYTPWTEPVAECVATCVP